MECKMRWNMAERAEYRGNRRGFLERGIWCAGLDWWRFVVMRQKGGEGDAVPLLTWSVRDQNASSQMF